MKSLYAALLSLAILAVSALSSCDNSEEVGASLNQADVSIVIDSIYELNAQSVDNDRLLSRTTTQLLGAINVKGYGSLTSDVVTQFMPAATIETDGVTVNDIDSIRLVLSIPNGGFVGDSIAPMGLEVYRLTRQLPSRIYSNFDPTGYYDPTEMLASQVYACNSQGYSDSIQSLNYRGVIVKLPVELARELFTLYVDDPQSFLSPDAFTRNFPGLYIRTSYGGGCIIRVSNTLLQMFYHRMETDDEGKPTAKTYVGNYFGVTPEIVTNNIIDYNMSSQLSDLAEGGASVISAPTGYDVRLTYPLEEMISRYRQNKGTLSVVNDLKLVISADEIANDYGIAPPPSLLLVLSKDKEKFFADNALVDGITSFVADYDKTTATYTFQGMREYILDALTKDKITADDYTFTLTPVYLNTVSETNYYGQVSTTISSIVPYINTPAMARLNLKKSKIIFTYSNQSIKF